MYQFISGCVIRNKMRYKEIQTIQNTLMKHLTVVCKHKNAHLADVRFKTAENVVSYLFCLFFRICELSHHLKTELEYWQAA